MKNLYSILIAFLLITSCNNDSRDSAKKWEDFKRRVDSASNSSNTKPRVIIKTITKTDTIRDTIKVIQDPTAEKSVNYNTLSSLDENIIAGRIRMFLSAENHRDISSILSCFSPNLQRYWDIQYPTKAMLSNRYFTIWAKIRNNQNILKNIERVNEHTYIYIVDYTFYSLKDQTYKTVYNSRIRVVFDDNYKIISIFGV